MKEDRDFRDLFIAAEVEECNTYTEVYWKMLAIKKRKAWLIPISWRLVYLGSDEYWRRTLVIGPFVFALWTMADGKLIHKNLENKFKYMMDETLL